MVTTIKLQSTAMLRRVMWSTVTDIPTNRRISSIFRLENCSYILDIEAVCSSETSVCMDHNIWRHFLEAGDFNFLCLFLPNHVFLSIRFILFYPPYIFVIFLCPFMFIVFLPQLFLFFLLIFLSGK
jgi:hypothetical protein